MQLKITKSKDSILLTNINKSKISEIKISYDHISISINSRIIYRQEFNKIELLSDYIEFFSDITKIISEKHIELKTTTSEININSYQNIFKSDLYESYSNSDYKISSSVIFLDNA